MTNVMDELVDPQQLVTLKKEMAKTKRMVLNEVQDHIVPHIVDKNTTKDMWDAVVKLYQDPIENQKMILKEKLRSVRMQKGEDVTSYLSRIQGIRDELTVVGEEPLESELVRTTLNRFSKEWRTFVQVISR